VVTLTDTSVDHNTASGNGGGIYNSGYSGTAALNLDNSDVTSNTVTGNGGGIYNDGAGGTATVTFANTTNGTGVSKNTAVQGGGLYNTNDTGTATVNLDTHTSVNKNTASGPLVAGVSPGGGILNLGTLLLGGVPVTNSTANGVVTHNTPDNIDT
jgi:predicted outer membrane repeat protein